MRNKYKSIFMLGLLLILGMMACEYDAVKPGWEKPFAAPEPPVIEAMEPEAGVAGANTIDVVGKNFASTLDSVFVYFDNIPADVLSTSSTRITVRRPNLISEGTTVNVASYNAYETARYPGYRMEPVLYEWGVFAGDITVIGATAVDAQENVYAFKKVPRVLFKVAIDGTQEEIAYPSALIYDMKAGPNGNLICMMKKKQVLELNVATGEETVWAEFPKNATYGDFDEYGNLHTAGKKTQMMVKPVGGAAFQTGYFKDDQVFGVRVFNGAVYALVEVKKEDETHPKTAIWKMPILDSSGNLGEPEVFLNWAETGDYAETIPTTFTFSADGICYVGTDHENPVLMVKAGGELDVLYKEILPTPSKILVWGTGNYLYQVIHSANIKYRKIDMGAPGAPYFGRTL